MSKPIFITLAAIFFTMPASACEWPWGKFTNPGNQDFEVFEKIDLEDGSHATGIKFHGLKGPYAKKYAFVHFRDECVVQFVSLGRYSGGGFFSNSNFHLDFYTADFHSTLGFYKRAPSYKKIR
ncbi:MAG: hypothetical protein AAGA63_07925, partial [Pseudomonadota bacterium]